MLPETSLLLSNYLTGAASLDRVRESIEGVDWDSPEIPEGERSFLLGIEARVVGIDEGLNDEFDLKDFIIRSMEIQLFLPSDQPPVYVAAGTSNSFRSHEVWTDAVTIPA